MIRVLIADDHPIVRHGVGQLLSAEPDMTIAGEAATSAEVLDALDGRACDLLLLDLSMPGRGGQDVLADVRSRYPALPVVVLTMHNEPQFAVRAIKAGAAGYVTKDSAGAELVRAVRAVVSGQRYVASALAEPLASYLAEGSDRKHERLSERESRVLDLLVAGQTVTEIADELALSVKTVSTYRTRLLHKLHVDSTAALVRYALEHRLVE